MNRLAPQTDAAHLAAVKKYLADHLRGAPMPDVWLESLQAVIRMAENRRGDEMSGRPAGDASNADSGSLPPAQPGSDTPDDPDDCFETELGAVIRSLGYVVNDQRCPAYSRHAAGAAIKHLRDLERELAAAKEALPDLNTPMPESFAEYVARNYPPDTVIARPLWHAPKLWGAAMRALHDAARRAMGEKT